MVAVNRDKAEVWWVTIRMDKKGIILVIVHAFTAQGRNKRELRIVSARKATKNEIKHFEGETL